MNISSRTQECNSIEDILIFLSSKLSEYKVPRHIGYQTMLLSEEVMNVVMKQVKPEKVNVRYSNSFGTTTIKYSYEGPIPEEIAELQADNYDPSSKILSYYSHNLKLQHQYGFTTITVLQNQSLRNYSKKIIAAILLAIIAGLVVSLMAPQETVLAFEENVLYQLDTLFIDALALVSMPITFLCIISNISTYINLADRFPHIKRVEGRFVMTSILSIVIGFLVFQVSTPLRKWFMQSYNPLDSALAANSEGLTLQSVWNGIIGIVPDNLFAPFVNESTLQLIFVAIVIGIAVGLVDRETGKIKEAMDIVRNLFCKIGSIFFHFSPLIVFMFLFTLMLYYGPIALAYELFTLVLVFAGLLAMTVWYIFELRINGIKPFEFISKIKKCLIEGFRAGDSVVAVPTTVKYCEKNLNLPRRPLEVAISLGASTNMDAIILTETILILTFAGAEGMELTPSKLLFIFFLILGTSFGVPTSAGSLTVVAMVILPTVGLDPALLTTVVFVEAIVNNFLSAFDVFGNVVAVKITDIIEQRRS